MRSEAMRCEHSDGPTPSPDFSGREGLPAGFSTPGFLALGSSAELPRPVGQDETKGGGWGPAAGLLLLHSRAPHSSHHHSMLLTGTTALWSTLPGQRPQLCADTSCRLAFFLKYMFCTACSPAHEQCEG